jgi:uroporphyrinogen decarboxylase
MSNTTSTASSTSTSTSYQPDIATTEETLNYGISTLNTSYPIPSSYFPALKNTTILDVASGSSSTAAQYTPVWVHRQAGRYLPEFRSLRQNVDFFTMCQTPTLACEVTLQPIRRFPLDAAIIFSDILVIPQCIGMVVEMHAGKGPVLPQPIRTPDDMQRLKRLSREEIRDNLSYVMKAITLTRLQLHGTVPLIGFSGAPWTLMAYMIEGGGAKSYDKARAWFYRYPKETHELLSLLTHTIIEYLIAQVEAGAQILEIFDSWAGELSPDVFIEFSLPCLKKIAHEVKKRLKESNIPIVPMTIFPKGAHYALELLSSESEYDVISLDWSMTRRESRKRLNHVASHELNGYEANVITRGNDSAIHKTRPMVIQGNLDVSVLYADEERIRSEVRKMIDGFGTDRYIVNLGHGMLPDHDPVKLGIMIDEVHRYSKVLIDSAKKQTSSSAS